MKRLLTAALLGALATGAMAADQKADEVVRKAIASLVPEAKIDSIADAKLPGFYEVAVAGQIVYVSTDGQYLLQGMVYDIPNKVDLTEQGRAKLRKAALDRVPAERKIVFAPEHPKHRVTVFTDIDCGYCRKLHSQIAEYNKLGIAVEYLFFPRAGIGSDSYDKAVTVWCSDNRQEALTLAKSGTELDKKECPNPVADDYNLGLQIGVTGTPMIVAPNGVQLGGYVPPEQMLQRLEALDQQAKS